MELPGVFLRSGADDAADDSLPGPALKRCRATDGLLEFATSRL